MSPHERHKACGADPLPWRVPVARDDIPENGQHFELSADAPVRAAVAKLAGLRELPRFEAAFDVTRRGEGLHVAGAVSATVGQTCVVTLEPLTNDVSETINLVFLPRPAVAGRADDGEAARREPKWDDPEPLVDGGVDLGALATEFLMLGLDPYPRKAGAVFEPPVEKNRDPGPFAALAQLSKKGH
jgi:uncharacterized metal-binding protein YceD (DUF177 family)